MFWENIVRQVPRVFLVVGSGFESKVAQMVREAPTASKIAKY